MQIAISVVVPTYKRAELLNSCLRNLCHQTFDYRRYEIIIVTDGPDKEIDDVTSQQECCKSKNIRFLSLAVKKGPAAARNVGWQNAKGTLVAFTDDDCLPETVWLENIWKHYRQEREIAFAGKVIVPVSENPTDFEVNTKGLETGTFVTANCVCSRAVLEAIGGFDEAFSAAWREDTDLEFRLLKRNVPIIRLEDVVVVHPVRKAKWGISMKEQRKIMFDALLFTKYPRWYRQRIKRNPSWRYYLMVSGFVVSAVSTFLQAYSLAFISFLAWFYFTIAFIVKRLTATKKTFSHIFEMIVTSIAIPFLSVYWTLYGAIKYRVWFF